MWVDGRVHHDPGTSTQLSPRGEVYEGWPLVRPQRIHNQAARLQASGIALGGIACREAAGGAVCFLPNCAAKSNRQAVGKPGYFFFFLWRGIGWDVATEGTFVSYGTEEGVIDGLKTSQLCIDTGAHLRSKTVKIVDNRMNFRSANVLRVM